MITEVEETLNMKKTANAERGMTGFQTKYLAKIRGINEPEVESEEPRPDEGGEEGKSMPIKADFRSRMEDKLQELKQKQVEKEQE